MALVKLEMNNLTPKDYEQWLAKYNYEPYAYDDFLQKIEWINDLSKAIKEVSKVIGEGSELEYRYWNDLSSWEFILNSISVARQFGFSFSPKISWELLIEQFQHWVESIRNRDKTEMLFLSGAGFFLDMVQFFDTGRNLVNPIRLASEILNSIEGGSKVARLSAEEVANRLIEKYRNNRKRFMINVDDFKSLAGRKKLKDAFLWDVDEELREHEYCIIDLREFNDSIAIIKVSTIINNWQLLQE